MNTISINRPVHTCPNRAMFQPNCPACVAGALELAGADLAALPPAMATPTSYRCLGTTWCDCPFCPTGDAALTQPAAPLPLPTDARLYRMVTTRRDAYVWATDAGQARCIFSGEGRALGVPRAPQADCLIEDPDTGLSYQVATSAWAAWHHRYRYVLLNRLDRAHGECLISVEGPYPR